MQRWAAHDRVLRPSITRDGGHDASHTGETIRTSGTPPRSASTTTRRGDARRSRNKTIQPRDRARNRTRRPRPLNGCTLDDRPTPLTVPHPAADHPEHAIERGKQESQTSPEKDDARVDDEPLHNEAHKAAAGTTTTRKTPPRTHTTRIVERARKRNAITETHFRSDLSR